MKIIAFALVLHLALSLHSPTPNNHHVGSQARHLAKTTDALYFEDQFTNFGNSVDYVLRALNTKEASKYSILISQTTQIKNTIQQLKDQLQQQKLLVTKSSVLCPGVTTFNRTALRISISSLQNAQKKTENTLATCADCTFVSDDLNQLKNTISAYIKHLNLTLDGQYCQKSTNLGADKPLGLVNLNNSFFKPNLKAKNWYFGAITKSDYKVYVFKRAISCNLTSCPIDAPFVKQDQQNCFDCPAGSIFNLGTENCDTCKPNQILNVESGQCDPCLGQKVFTGDKLACRLCILSDEQLFNQTSGKCYKCGADSYLDTDKLACVKIGCNDSTPRFDLKTKKCEPCGISEIVDPSDVTKCIKTNFIGLCPPSKPIYDFKTKACVECPANSTSCSGKKPSHFHT